MHDLIKPLLVLGAVVLFYKIVDNTQGDPNETHLDGWQSTAEHMRPTPKSVIELESDAHPRAPLPR